MFLTVSLFGVHVAVQTCTVTVAQLNALNYHNGTCLVDGSGNVVLDSVNARTCDFACKEGYYHEKGDTNIAFTCAYNDGATSPEGIDNWGNMTKCQGA